MTNLRQVGRALGAVALLWIAACQAAPPPQEVADKTTAVRAARARLVVPPGWERALWAVVEPLVGHAQRGDARRRFEAAGVIEVEWTPAIEAALHGVRDVVTVQWVRPNQAWGDACQGAGRPRKALNRSAADTSNIDLILPGGASGFDLTGAGVTLGEWDEGAPRTSHQEFGGRARVIDGAGPVAHSTEVAGTMVARGVAANARGMAFGAHLLAFDWDLDLLELYDTDARIAASNHSYGAILGWDDNGNCGDLPSWLGGMSFEDPAFGKYMADASALDAVIRARDLVVIWAAGNERQDSGVGEGEPHYHWPDCTRTFTDAHDSELLRDYDTIGGQPTMKNGIVVGAVGDVTADPAPTFSIVPEPYSSFGPMDDGRIKPDVVANGESLFTTTSTADDAYETSSGTSLASPVVTGAVALLSEKYAQAYAGVGPRGAEIKALLLHTAHEAGDHPGPDYGFGFGLMDAHAAASLIDADGARDVSQRQLRVGSAVEGATLRFDGTDVVEAGTALRVTLVWHDVAGMPNTGTADDAAHALVNDLDVVLIAPDQQTRFHPWRLNAGSPVAAATRNAPNRVDNVEMVDVDADDNVWSGRWRAEVTVNGALAPRGAPQPFALVSSTPLAPASHPVLAVARVIEVDVPVGTQPASVTLPIRNTGAGALSWALNETTSWLSASAVTGSAPSDVTLSFDVSELTQAGEHVAWLDVDSNDPAGVRRVAVVLRFTCVADCTGRDCGIDPVCGTECGRCPIARACSINGTCVPAISACPAADLGSNLGVVAQGSTVGRSTMQSGSCGGDNVSDVSYRWTAPSAGLYEMTTLGSAFDTLLYLRDGDCSGTELACNDDSGGLPSTVSAWLDAGQSVVVTVDGFDGAGTYALTIAEVSCPLADLGSALGGVVLQGSTLGGVDTTAGSCGGDHVEDIAVRWTAPAAGDYRFSTEGSGDDVDTVLYALAGDCRGAERACDDARNSGGRHAVDEVMLSADAGESFVIVIDGHAVTDTGDVTLRVVAELDRCEGACGGTPNSACFCDASCVALGDCCVDACSSCGHCACVPDCTGAVCGDDGCGGSCGGCGSGERCSAGACEADPCAGVSCEACEACVEGSCVALPELAGCDDGVRCTVLDQCSGGECVGTPLQCNDNDTCTTEACDETTGLCVFDRMSNCCSADDDCADSDTCTTDTCNLATQRCRNLTRPDCCRAHAECDDGNACTDDTCLLGVCVFAAVTTCGDDAGALDGAVADDAGWAQAEVSGGGCDCRIARVASDRVPLSRRTWWLWWGVSLALAWRTRVRRRSRAVAAEPPPRRLP